MARKRNSTSEMDVAERMSTPLVKRLGELITDKTALKNYLGISVQSINQYLLGGSYPSLENLCKIADFYGVTTDYLLGRTNTQSPDPTLQAVCDYTGLSEGAISAIRHDLSQKRLKGSFVAMDFLIREFFLSYWAFTVWTCVENIGIIQKLGTSLGEDVVEDRTKFHKWNAVRRFEQSLDEAIKELSAQYAVTNPTDKAAYLAEQKKKFTEMLDRIHTAERDMKKNGKH